jgi:hypothetical protein
VLVNFCERYQNQTFRICKIHVSSLSNELRAESIPPVGGPRATCGSLPRLLAKQIGRGAGVLVRCEESDDHPAIAAPLTP